MTNTNYKTDIFEVYKNKRLNHGVLRNNLTVRPHQHVLTASPVEKCARPGISKAFVMHVVEDPMIMPFTLQRRTSYYSRGVPPTIKLESEIMAVWII